jgi:signal transduction histidine kinase
MTSSIDSVLPVEGSSPDLDEALRVRDEFIATAGHELKTPLAALLLHVQSLQRAARDGAPENLAERLEKIARGGQRLERLINQLLDVSRITAGRLRLDPSAVNLGDLLQGIVTQLTSGAAEITGSVALTVKDHVDGHWDRTRLDQVFSNLVRNAIKYGGGKPVEVILETDGGWAVTRVIDRGIGIDADHQRRLFARFERLPATREYGGFGLGLWVARQLVEASGGTIEVESAPGVGSTFTVRLPLDRADGSHGAP